VPSGYLLRASGEVVLDPDESVRAVVRFVFEQFERLGTAHAVLRAMVEQGSRWVCAVVREPTAVASNGTASIAAW
jgi:hypothetical protein